MTSLRRLIRSNRAATAIEYGLIAALVAIAAVTAMSALGNKISQTMNNSVTDMG
jgi:pilus assembly protein Flp/PilA